MNKKTPCQVKVCKKLSSCQLEVSKKNCIERINTNHVIFLKQLLYSYYRIANDGIQWFNSAFPETTGATAFRPAYGYTTKCNYISLITYSYITIKCNHRSLIAYSYTINCIHISLTLWLQSFFSNLHWMWR